MNLNTSSWRPFILANLYEILMGDKLDKNKTSQDNPTVNFVSRISRNNGVDAVIDRIDGLPPHPAGLLTVSLGGEYLGSCYVQKALFYTSQNIAIMKPQTSEMSFEVNIFICSLVKYECKTKYYAFGRELNTHIRTDFEIFLPIQMDNVGMPIIDNNCFYSDEGFIPDWKFMEDYIKSLRYKPLTTCNGGKEKSDIETNKWAYFEVPKLFDVCAGNYYNSGEYEEGNMPYISASNENNGVGRKINLTCDFNGNKITIGKVGATTFYQSEDFCATSDVNILTPKFKMNKHIGLFIVSILNFSENFKWSYGRQCRIGDTKEIKIKLPIKTKDNGNPFIDEDYIYSNDGYVPDWGFMENYIKKLPYGDRI